MEPMVEVILPGQEKVTYVQVNPEMVAAHRCRAHLVNGNPVAEYTIGAAEGNESCNVNRRET